MADSYNASQLEPFRGVVGGVVVVLFYTFYLVLIFSDLGNLPAFGDWLWALTSHTSHQHDSVFIPGALVFSCSPKTCMFG